MRPRMPENVDSILNLSNHSSVHNILGSEDSSQNIKTSRHCYLLPMLLSRTLILILFCMRPISSSPLLEHWRTFPLSLVF